MSRAPLQAWYLPPSLETGLETTTQRFGPAHEAVDLSIPVVSAADLPRWIDALRAARATHLATRNTRAVARPLERVARRFLDPADASRRGAVEALARAGRFAAPEVERALDDAFTPLAGGGIDRWIASELGSVAALDRVTPRREGPPRLGHGPEWMLQVYAGNVPAIPIWPMFAALLLRSALLAKTSSREPLLAPLIARAIAEEDPALGASLAVVWWKGGAADLDRAAVSRAPAVLAFGSGESMECIAGAARAGAIVVLHGPRVSAACVAREAMTAAGARDAARRAALDISLYDQQGCLSPHSIYVERGGRVTPGEFAAALGEALEVAARALPPAPLPAEDAARLRLHRAQAEFEAAAGGAVTGVIASREGAVWTVVVELGARFEPGPTHRTVRVHAVSDLEEVMAALRPHARHLEAIALEAAGPRRAELAAALAALGVPRVAAVGRLQQPSPLGTHGGVGFLAPFVRWTTVDGARGSGASRPTRASASRSSGRGSRRGEAGSRRSR